MRKNLISNVAALLLLLAAAAEAQLPRPATPFRSSQIRQHILKGSFPRTVTVAKDGNADYTEPDTACTYLASQARSATATWLVLVYPGNYTTDCDGTPVATPTFTTVVRYELIAARPARTVTVCSSGCAYKTLKVAADYVATQSPTQAAQWVINVYENTTETASTTIPEFVHVNCSPSGNIYAFGGGVKLAYANNTGTAITLRGSMSGCQIHWQASPVGAVTIILADGTGTAGYGDESALDHVGIHALALSGAAAITLVEVPASRVFFGYYVELTPMTTNTASAALRTAGTALLNNFGINDGGTTRNFPAVLATAVANYTVLKNGTIGKTYGASGFTADIRNDGTAPVHVYQTNYRVLAGSGPITTGNDRDHSPVETANPSTCAPGEVWVNSTTSAICFCTAADTPRCAVGS